jgi:predicted transcriptional regulator
MKTINFSVDEDLLEKARSVARAQRTTLNEAFRQWLAEFTSREGDGQRFDALMHSLEGVDAGRSFIREELSQR